MVRAITARPRGSGSGQRRYSPRRAAIDTPPTCLPQTAPPAALREHYTTRARTGSYRRGIVAGALPPRLPLHQRGSTLHGKKGCHASIHPCLTPDQGGGRQPARRRVSSPTRKANPTSVATALKGHPSTSTGNRVNRRADVLVWAHLSGRGQVGLGLTTVA